MHRSGNSNPPFDAEVLLPPPPTLKVEAGKLPILKDGKLASDCNIVPAGEGQPTTADMLLEAAEKLPTETAEPIDPPLTVGLFASNDIEEYAKFGITPELLERATIGRVSDYEARTHFLIKHSGKNCGTIFKYYDLDGKYVTARLRRDPEYVDMHHPKYIMPTGRPTCLYFVSGCAKFLADLTIPIVLVEAEKSVLALTAWAEFMELKLWPIGLGGCWGWSSHGRPLPELATCCHGRTVFIMLDANAATNSHVRMAQARLARVLKGFGATKVLIATVPKLEGVNGPDDLIAQEDGYSVIKEVMEKAVPAREFAILEAEAGIAAIADICHAQKQPTVDDINRGLRAVADVSNPLQRELFEGQLGKALHGIISKGTVHTTIAELVKEYKEERDKYAQQLKYITAEPVNTTKLVESLNSFYAERLHLPPDASLLLAYWTLNTWTFDVFDTTPYLSLESAVPQCGKSTALRLLSALSCRSRKSTSLTEAVLFRIIDAESPTLLIDEAEIMKGRSERAEALRPIANEGYKKGATVPRCVGESHDIHWFDVYCPKVFAGIGGLDGTLLDRCIVIHMERAPKGHVRKSTRDRAVQKDSQPLVKQLEAYAMQSRDALRQLYEAEPDGGYWPSIADREAELWGPLLIHAKLIGPDAEAKLLAVANTYGQQKAEIQLSEWHIAQAIDLLDAVRELSGETFTPGDLLPALAESEAWAKTLADVKGHDEEGIKKAKAAKVGYFLRSFRLPKTKNNDGNKAYNRLATIKCLAAHVPGTPDGHPKHQKSSTDGLPSAQGIDTKGMPDSTDGSGWFSGGTEDEVGNTKLAAKPKNLKYVGAPFPSNHPHHPLNTNSTTPITGQKPMSAWNAASSTKVSDNKKPSVNHPVDHPEASGGMASPAGSQIGEANMEDYSERL